MSNNFRVGQKVVCIRRGPWRLMNPNGIDFSMGHNPRYGQVCTIAELFKGSLILEGFNPLTVYHRSRFRPAVDKPASIEVFRKMLVPSGVNA